MKLIIAVQVSLRTAVLLVAGAVQVTGLAEDAAVTELDRVARAKPKAGRPRGEARALVETEESRDSSASARRQSQRMHCARRRGAREHFDAATRAADAADLLRTGHENCEAPT
jgi:hypothetical protein